jgi:hypothetical protein
MSFLQFDATAVAPQQPIEAIPAGMYLAAISESEVVMTKSGSGQMLRLTWDVLEGPMKGRKVFDRLNIANQNPKAEEIGQRQLSTLCHAVGVLQVKETTQLHGRPCHIRVTVRKDESGQYADQNEVKDYRAINGQAPAAATAAPAPAVAPAAKKFAPPWAGNKAA